MDYAILKTGSKQYTVKMGDVIDVEKLPVEEGSTVELTDVLAVSRDGELTFGNPLVPSASVLAQVQAHNRDKKIIVFKYKRKTRYRRKKGHRQPYTRLAIMAIVSGDEEIGVQEWEVTTQEELPADAVAAEVEDESSDELGDEPLDKPEDEIIDESREEVVDQVMDGPDNEARNGGES